LPILSKISPNPLDSPRFKFESSSLGGVAVLVVLAVIARSRDIASIGWGEFCSCGKLFGVLEPKDNVLPAARKEKDNWDSGIGGTGISWMGTSVEEGSVEEELKLADEALSYSPAVEAELLVPPLPLEPVHFATLLSRVKTYRFSDEDASIPANTLSGLGSSKEL
jgi:hypothetical protein